MFSLESKSNFTLVKADLGGTPAEKAFLEVIFKEFGMLEI